MRAAPLHLRLAASPLLASVLLIAHGAAMAGVLVSLPGWWMPALATAALGASLVFHVRRDALQRSGFSVTGLLLKDGARGELTLKAGNMLTGKLQGSTFVAPLLIVINIRLDESGRRRAVILLPDSAPAEDLRRLRVWLRHCHQPETSASGAP